MNKTFFLALLILGMVAAWMIGFRTGMLVGADREAEKHFQTFVNERRAK